MSYDQFRVYVSRIRKRLGNRVDEAPRPQDSLEGVPGPVPQPTVSLPADDPLANIRRELERKPNSGFNYSPFPDRTD
jgi:hypothetical protein